MVNLNKIAIELEEKGTPFAWATIVDVRGSAPRHIGSKMIVTLTESFDTIGGGSLEHKVIEDARRQIKLCESKKTNYSLAESAGQCCGGDVDVFIEPISPSNNVVIFGAGHVAEKLVPLLNELHFKITLIDERPEQIERPIFNHVYNRMNELPEDALKEIEFNDRLYIIVLTHEHKDDEKIVEYCIEKPFRYLGMIGSRTKWNKFKQRYKAKGISQAKIERVTTPIGLDIGGETPFEIAVSIVAELIKIDSKPKGFEEYKQCPA